ncbi:MAG: hypothetical protein PHV30_07045 [Candidatus Margulisbacteria bacterium]|nr:hypothetical protein [Candidatus Margulisiibacteriota bacterium]
MSDQYKDILNTSSILVYNIDDKQAIVNVIDKFEQFQKQLMEKISTIENKMEIINKFQTLLLGVKYTLEKHDWVLLHEFILNDLKNFDQLIGE